MASYTNDSKVLSIPLKSVSAELSYTSVQSKEYPGVGASSQLYTPTSQSNTITTQPINKLTGVSLTEGNVSVAKPKVSGSVDTITVVDDNTGTQTGEATPTKYTTVDKVGLGVTIINPDTPSPTQGITADDVSETKTRIWFTPDERVALRTMYEQLLDLEDYVDDLIPEVERTVVFCLPDVPDATNPIEIRFPWDGKLKEVELNFSRFVPLSMYQTGPIATNINIQRCSASDYAVEPIWVNILPLYATLDENTKRVVVPVNLDIAKDDMFRLTYLDVSICVKNIVVQLVISTD